MATTCLHTRLRNISGSAKSFSFLPSHGVWLEDGEEWTFKGDLLAWLSVRGLERKLKSYLQALDDGQLALVSTPSQHFYDEELDETKVLEIVDGDFVAADPCWGPYSSSVEYVS